MLKLKPYKIKRQTTTTRIIYKGKKKVKRREEPNERMMASFANLDRRQLFI